MNNPVARDSKRPYPNLMPPDVQGRLGKTLAQARQAKGLSETDVASKLRLSVASVQAIEQDQYDKIPNVFIRGYIKNYAHILGIDEAELPPLPKIEQPITPTSAPTKRSGPTYEIRSNHIMVQMVTWTIALGLIALLGLWWQGQLVWENKPVVTAITDTVDPTVKLPELTTTEKPEQIQALNKPQTPQMPVTTTALPPISPPSATTDQTALTNVNTPTPVTGLGGNTNVTISVQPSMLPALPTLPETPVVQQNTTPQIIVELTGKSSVNIRDSKRKFKLSGRMRKGDRHILEGDPPYTIKLGNSSAVRITVDGKLYDLKPHTKNGVANFTLDPANLEQ